MGLIEIKQFMEKAKVTSLFNLAAHFNAEPELLRSMLAIWQSKGCIRQPQKSPGCGSKCSKCDPLLTEIYEWVE